MKTIILIKLKNVCCMRFEQSSKLRFIVIRDLRPNNYVFQVFDMYRLRFIFEFDMT